MTVMVDAPVGEKKTWYGLSDACCREQAPLVCVPVDQLEGMSKEEIGACVLEAVMYAYYAQALNLAGIAGPPDFDESEIPWLVNLLTPYEGWDKRIHDALESIKEWQARIERRTSADASKSRKRREIARNYDTIFIALGRRDGFQCARCAATKNLEIDHIIPLAKNGSNEMDNLQLLCSTCNSKKGARLD